MTDDAEADSDRPVDEPSADGAPPADDDGAPSPDGDASSPDGTTPSPDGTDRSTNGDAAAAASDLEGRDGRVRDDGDAEDGSEARAVDPDESDSAGPNESDATASDGEPSDPMPDVPDPAPDEDRREIPEDVQKYARFQKMDGAQYERVNEFLRDRTYVTAREWAIARLCSDFRTETGVEMTKIGENLPELVPFMTDTYTPQAVNQARSSFEEKVRKAGATFLYGAMCDFFTAEELDDVMYEATEVAKFLLEVEGVDLTVEEELEAEERISSVMREVREASKELRENDED